MIKKDKRHVIDIGKLKHRITFQSQTQTPDDQGGTVVVWNDLLTVWASLKAISEYERIYSQAVQYRRSHKIVIRRSSESAAIDTSMQIKYEGRTFQIKAIIDNEEEKYFLLLDCEENVGT